MKRTFALSLLLFGLMSCSLLDENNPDPQPSNTAPTVTLSASTLSGIAPLQVTFTATASDAENDTLSYTWSIAGAANSPTASQTFTAAGSYPVSVTVSDGQLEASASTNITVTGSGTSPNPEPGPGPKPQPNITLNVTASSGGPVPWGVTYEVKASGDVPEGSKLSVTCADQPATDLSKLEDYKIENVFSCIHISAGEQVVVTLNAKNGEVLAQKEQTADVQTSAGVPFGRAWAYSGVTGDQFYESSGFNITQAVNSSTGRGEGEYTLEGYEPTLRTFTLSAKANKLTMKAPGTEVIPNPFDRSLVFIGSYRAKTPSGISAPDGEPQQVFYAPNTQSLDSNDGYLYTTK